MRLVCVVGTRPEAVKLAPLVRELRNQPHIHTDVINSGQHGNAPPKLLEELGLSRSTSLHGSVEYQRFLNSYQRVSLGGRRFVEF
jgi:UDP-N-acetylglucosamine 2-epimerase (non-hydrolysing)